MELQNVDAPALLQRLCPALVSFRDHLERLVELRGSSPKLASAATSDLEEAMLSSSLPESAGATEYIDGSIVLILKVVTMLLCSTQLQDATSQGTLLHVLAYYGEHSGTCSQPTNRRLGFESQPVEAPTDGADTDAMAVETCARAFDFFDCLRDTVSSVEMASQLLEVQQTLVEMQGRFGTEAPARWSRSARLAQTAEHFLTMQHASSLDASAPKPAPLLIRSIFECQANYTSEPLELLCKAANEWLPDISEGGSAEEQPYLTATTASHYLKVLFAMLDKQVKNIHLKFARVQARRLAAAAELDDDGDEVRVDDEVRLEHLEQLINLFVALIMAAKPFPATVAIAIRASASFLSWVNKDALSLISANFKKGPAQAISLLKSLQPATRLLQAQCSAVKQKALTAALVPAARLKFELEKLIYGIKTMLQENNCREGFWLGNLKHKNVFGEEVSSQMAVEPDGGGRSGRGRGRGGKRKAAEEEPEEDDEDECGGAGSEDDENEDDDGGSGVDD